jgi:ATP-dependent Clp protease ATP-binding subunit ClpC
MVVVIEDYPQFVSSCESIGVNIHELLERYLSSPQIQFVMTTNPSTYHHSLETNQALIRQFSQVTIEDPGLSASVRVLEAEAPEQEHLHGVIFTYRALEHIVENADQYIVEGVMPDKALSFMEEIASRAGQQGQKLVTADFVDVHTSNKTGIPTGPIQEEEKDLLLNLETVLHERVVGQDDAIQAIASTMRRARTGIQSKERPMGSFLFLGPTGVGKTETAKTLAHVFFDSDENMERLDMSEFSDDKSLERLIGSGNKPGVLSTTLREHPYCVLLLDEFEKASDEVHDLFLQILDEGIVTDARGQRINARNTIIIATSNAGSEMIWNLMQEGERPGDHEDKIIDKIIDEHIFKPELINRFDSAVIFESLSEDQQEQIAGLMLNALKERIKDKGYILEIDSSAISKLVTAGYDPKFGARPMRRVIQDVVEEKIARKIIEGSLQKGETIRLEESDITE